LLLGDEVGARGGVQDRGQRGLPRDPARRQAAELRHGERERRLRGARRLRARAAPHGRFLAREFVEGLPPAGGSGRRRGGPARGGREAHRGRHDREPHQSRAAGPGSGQVPGLRRFDYRCMPRLGRDGAIARHTGRRRAQAARRGGGMTMKEDRLQVAGGRRQEAGDGKAAVTVVGRTDDLRISGVRALIPPQLLLEELPMDAAALATVSTARHAVHRVLHGADQRLVVVVGPCSIHDREAAMEYARRLHDASERHAHDLLVVMRVYFEKPRTTVGWKGFINDPRLDGSFAINEGLRLARKLLLDINRLGLPCGTEFLDLLSPQYTSDLIAWGAIGARTTESQTHRQLASGLSCPVGFKNGTDGSIRVAVDALRAAAAPHAFMGMTKTGQAAIFETVGNEDCHVILRGGKAPNYDAANVEAAAKELAAAGLAPHLMIDFSHANSSKKYERQLDVARDVASQLAAGDERIVGVMVESHLQPGRQDLVPGQALAYGVSITDVCIGWEDTEKVLDTLAAAVRSRRLAHDE